MTSKLQHSARRRRTSEGPASAESLESRIVLTPLSGESIGMLIADGSGSCDGVEGARVSGCICDPEGLNERPMAPIRVLFHSTDHRGDTLAAEVSPDRSWMVQSLVPGQYSIRAFALLDNGWQSISDDAKLSLDVGDVVSGQMVPVSSPRVEVHSDDTVDITPAVVGSEVETVDLAAEADAMVAASNELLVRSSPTQSADLKIDTVNEPNSSETGAIRGRFQFDPESSDGPLDEELTDRRLLIRGIGDVEGFVIEVSPDSDQSFLIEGLVPGEYIVESLGDDFTSDPVRVSVRPGTESSAELILSLKPVTSALVAESGDGIEQIGLSELEVDGLYAAMGLATAGGFALESFLSNRNLNRRSDANGHPRGVIDLSHSQRMLSCIPEPRSTERSSEKQANGLPDAQ